MKLREVTSAYSQINNLMYKSYLPTIINTSVEIGVFDTLKEHPANVEELSTKLQTEEPTTEALLEVLSAIGFLAKQDDQYWLTNLSNEYLVSSSGYNQIGSIKQFSGCTGPLQNLSKALKGEEIEFDYKMWSSEEKMLGMEQMAKAGSIQEVVSFVSKLPEFANANKMCDLAGSSGYYSLALLNENPKLLSHVFDLPEVCRTAKEIKKSDPNFERIEFHDFDFNTNESFGEAYDMVFCSHFLYSLNRDKSIKPFLKRINKSLKTGGVFISNHTTHELHGDHYITATIIELITRVMGHPTHSLEEQDLKTSLEEAGFAEYTIRQPNISVAFPTVIIAARKIKEVE